MSSKINKVLFCATIAYSASFMFVPVDILTNLFVRITYFVMPVLLNSIQIIKYRNDVVRRNVILIASTISVIIAYIVGIDISPYRMAYTYLLISSASINAVL